MSLKIVYALVVKVLNRIFSVFQAHFLLIIIGAMGLLTACSDGSSGSTTEVAEAPVISSVYPMTITVGTEVKISGHDLQDAVVIVNGAEIESTLQDNHEIRFVSPELIEGEYVLEVKNNGGSDTKNVTYREGIPAESDDNAMRSPVTISGIDNIVKVAVGKWHICALVEDGRVACWGNNVMGQLGNGTLENSLSPVWVSGIEDAVDVVAGGAYSCALHNSGQVSCWGVGSFSGASAGTEGVSLTKTNGLLDYYGIELGDFLKSEPTIIPGIHDAVSLSGGSHRTCAVMGNGELQCWSYDSGNMYLPEWPESEEYIELVRNLQTDELIQIYNNQVAIGFLQMCFVLNDQQLLCHSVFGESAIQNSCFYISPSYECHYFRGGLMISLQQQVEKIVAGSVHHCVLSTEREVYCWGVSENGQLGDDLSSVNDSMTIVKINLSEVEDIAAGSLFGCALLSNGEVQCWGGTASEMPTTCPRYVCSFVLPQIEETFNGLAYQNSSSPTKVQGVKYVSSIYAAMAMFA